MATIGIIGLLRNSGELECRPGRIQGVEFDEFLTAAEIAAYSREERIRYEKDMVTKQDMHNAIEFAKQEGRQEGRQEGIAEGEARGEARGIESGLKQGIEIEKKRSEAKNLEIARTLRAAGVDLMTISKAIGMAVEELEKL